MREKEQKGTREGREYMMMGEEEKERHSQDEGEEENKGESKVQDGNERQGNKRKLD